MMFGMNLMLSTILSQKCDAVAAVGVRDGMNPATRDYGPLLI